MSHITKPEIYQGFKRRQKYFEGWYFKLVTADRSMSLALIPGISLAKADPHAFIQVFLVHHGEKPSLKTTYVRFPVQEFVADKKAFHVSVGMNQFSFSHVHLDLRQNHLTLQGDLQIENITPLNKGFLNPSIMGPFAYLPNMECSHGVLSLSHIFKGKLKIDGVQVDFTGGKGYLEKDWGSSFPSHYVWMQGNHFSESNTSFFFSYANIPYLGLRFQGLICHLYVNGVHHRFATYNQSKVIAEILSDKQAEYVIKKGPYRLKIIGKIDEVVNLPSPKLGKMDHAIKEGLSGHIALWLMKGKTVLYQGETTLAGIEIMKKR
jgi:tocopherol cyclase